MKKNILLSGPESFIGSAFMLSNENQKAFNFVTIPRVIDLRDMHSLKKFCENQGSFDYILHFADKQPDPRGINLDGGENFLANGQITLNILRLWKEQFFNAKFIAFDTLWSYPKRCSNIAETEYWSGPLDETKIHYGIQKKYLLSALHSFKSQWDMRGSMFVLGNIYGPRDNSNRIIPTILKKMLQQDESITIYSDGLEKRNFIYIDDQVRAIAAHLDLEETHVNLLVTPGITVRDLVSLAAKLTNFSGKIIYTKGQQQQKPKIVNAELIKSISGWPENSNLQTLEEGLQKTISYLVNNPGNAN